MVGRKGQNQRKAEEMEYIVDIIRHGMTTTEDRSGFIAGLEPEMALVPEGEEQIRVLGDRYQAARIPVGYVGSSALKRARQSAHIFRSRLSRKLGPGLRDAVLPSIALLNEMDQGEWSGKWRTQIDSQDLALMDEFGMDFRPPGGETQREVAARMIEFLQGLFTRAPGERIVLFSHAIAIRCLKCAVEGTLDAHPDLSKVRIDFGSIMRLGFNYKRNRWELLGFNLTHP